MIKNRWNEKIEVLGRGRNNKMVKVIFHNECKEVYEVSKSCVKDGCELKNRKTKSLYSTGFLDYDKNTGTFKHNKKERSLWKSLMKKFNRKGIECEKYCSFVEFCKVLRKHDSYNDIIFNDSVIITKIEKNGEIKISKRYNYTSVRVKRTNLRTGRVTIYDSLEQLANEIGYSTDHLRKVVNTDRLVKGCKLEYID